MSNVPPTAPVAIPIHWVDSPKPDPVASNTLAIQLTPDGALLSFGFAKPPYFAGPLDGQQEQMNAVESIDVQAQLRIVIAYTHIPEIADQFRRAADALIAAGVLVPQEQPT